MSDVSAFNLDGYLARIGWVGSREPTAETASGVLRAHMRAIPFENLDVLLGRPIRIDVDSVYGKLVEGGRGGYCFEHGTLLGTALAALGFTPVAHTARVINMRPRAEAPRTHMFLTLQLDGSTFVFDPGFGGMAPAVPVPLAGGIVRDGGERHRIVRQGAEWVLEAIVNDVPVPLWTSALDSAEPVDFVMANHFVSTFPESIFVTRLMLRSFASIGRVAVLNRDVTIRREGHEERRVLADRAELRRLLGDHFGFDLPDVEQMRVPSVEGWSESGS